MYKLYLNKILLPVTPSSIKIETDYSSEKLNLINGKEINIPQSIGLKKISFEALLPASPYPFAMYDGPFKSPDYFIKKIERLKLHHFRTLLITNNGRGLNISTTVENLSVSYDSENGRDVVIGLSLCEYRDFGTKVGVIVEEKKTAGGSVQMAVASPSLQRPADPPKPKTHTVKRGDCLWKLAKKYYGNGGEYMRIANANGLKNPNVIRDGQVLIIP